MGLTSNDLVVLQALISFMPKRDTATASQMTIVFPSNAALSERTNGLDERTLRRCIARLVDSGLISRRDSATRKRFPLRYGGIIRDAFGFDLAPMYVRERELRAWSDQIAEDAEHLRSLRAKALALRVQVLNQTQDAETIAQLAGLRNTLRRATLSPADVIVIIEHLQSMVSDDLEEAWFPAGNQTVDPAETDEMSATDGQNDRLVEATRLNFNKVETDLSGTPTLPASKPKPEIMEWADLEHVSAFYPQEPRDAASVLRIITEIGTMLRISSARIRAQYDSRGPRRVLLALDSIIGKATEIRNPTRYLDSMLT